MYGTEEFRLVLSALATIAAAGELTDAEKADARAVVREEFLSRAHDPRLMAIVDRITTPVVVVEETSEDAPAPKSRRGKGA